MSTTIQQNYFELFALPIQFDVNHETLTNNYHQLQAQFHPDRYAGKSQVEKNLALQYTALINEAYQTLKSPIKRAKYLLEIVDIHFDEDTTSQIPAEFLMQQMELHETLMAIEMGENERAGLVEMQQQLHAQFHSLCDEFVANYLQKNYAQAKETVEKMQFVDKLQMKITSKI